MQETMMNYLYRFFYVNILITVYRCVVSAQNSSSLEKQDADVERRYIKSNRQYLMHVQKLKEVNGLKTHNLRAINATAHSPFIYINNPVESKIPNAYLTVEQYKDAMVQRVENQKKDFANHKDNTLFINTNTKFKPFKHDVLLLNNGRSKYGNGIFSTIKPATIPSISNDSFDKMYSELIENFTSDIISHLENKIREGHENVIHHDLISKANEKLKSTKKDHISYNKHKELANTTLDDQLSEEYSQLEETSSNTDDEETSIEKGTNDTNTDFITGVTTTEIITNKTFAETNEPEITQTTVATTVNTDESTLETTTIEPFLTTTNWSIIDTEINGTTVKTNKGEALFKTVTEDITSARTTNETILVTIAVRSTFNFTTTTTINETTTESNINKTTLITRTDISSTQTTNEPTNITTTDKDMVNTTYDNAWSEKIINEIDTKTTVNATLLKTSESTTETTTGKPTQTIIDKAASEPTTYKPDVRTETVHEAELAETITTSTLTVQEVSETPAQEDAVTRSEDISAQTDLQSSVTEETTAGTNSTSTEQDKSQPQSDTTTETVQEETTTETEQTPSENKEEETPAQEETTVEDNKKSSSAEGDQTSLLGAGQKVYPSEAVKGEALSENKEETPKQEETTVEAEPESPAEGEQESAAEVEQVSPADVEQDSPAEGEHESPAEVEQVSPAEGEQGSPAEGEQDSPTEAAQETTASETVQEEILKSKEDETTAESETEETQTVARKITTRRKPPIMTRPRRRTTTTQVKSKWKTRNRLSKPHVFLGE